MTSINRNLEIGQKGVARGMRDGDFEPMQGAEEEFWMRGGGARFEVRGERRGFYATLGLRPNFNVVATNAATVSSVSAKLTGVVQGPGW
jgi:hypothetical protein